MNKASVNQVIREMVEEAGGREDYLQLLKEADFTLDQQIKRLANNCTATEEQRLYLLSQEFKQWFAAYLGLM